MAYGVRYDSYTPDEAKRLAEMRALRAGEVWGLGFLYRFEAHTYSQSSGWGDDEYYSVGPFLELDAFAIRSHTPKGWTISASNGLGWRFIRRDATKRFACPTVQEALESFAARKRKEASIHDARAARARKMEELAAKHLNKEHDNAENELA